MYNQATCKALRVALKEALKSVEEKFNAKIDVDNVRMTYDFQSIRFKFEMNSKESSTGNIVPTTTLSNVRINPLSPLAIGEVYARKNTYYTIKGFLPDRPKFSIRVQTQRGKTWLVEPSFLQACTKIS